MELRKRETIVAPLAVVVPVFAMGIITAHLCPALTLFVWAVLVGASLLAGVVMPRTRVAAVLVGVFAVGGLNTSLRNLDQAIPLDTPIDAVVEVVSHSQSAGSADVRVVEWGTAQGQTYRSNKLLKTTYSADTLLQVGTRLKCHLRVRPFSQGSYARLMSARGFVGRSHLEECRVVGHRTSPRSVAARVQSAAVSRLQRLGLESDDQTVAEAMVLGCRRGLKGELRDRYADTGNSHLLAVSGLHIGLVFVLVNVLLLFLPTLRYGHILKNIAAVILIWAFAFVSGLSPSAVRAALMFGMMQIGLAVSVEQNSLNTICGAALLMLTASPHYLFDVSFQLSFVAVVGIALWFPLLYSRIRSESRLLNRVWSLVLVGVCATVAVLPLVAYVFGRVSLLGVVMGPLLVVLAQITIVAGLLWCALPVEALSGVFRSVLGASVGWQNDIVGAVARLPFCAVEWRPSMLGVVIIYLAMLAATACLWRVARGRKTQKITFE